jgi:hypothetical protein
MFLGHFAVGFAAKRAAPRASLTILMVAATLLDLLWPLFLWLGIEQVDIRPASSPFEKLDFISYPWSHSLLLALVWSGALALLYRAARRDTKAALIIGAAVFSHWVLDWITHLPDLPLVPGAGPKFGLRLWDAPTATLVIELAMFAGGLTLYLATTRARNVAGHVSLWSIVALLALAYWGNVVGPPPPSVTALKTVALAGSVLTLWFLWVDRTRTLRARTA